MSDYIKREDVEQIFTEWCHKEQISVMFCDVIMRRLQRLPSADVVEVKHGKWKRVPYKTQGHEEVVTDGYSWCCTNCGDARRRNEPAMLFCPNCGAKMDGGEEE